MKLKELKRKPYFIRSYTNKNGVTKYTYCDGYVIILGKKDLDYEMNDANLWSSPLWFQELFKTAEKKLLESDGLKYMISPWTKKQYLVEKLMGSASLGYPNGWEWYLQAEKTKTLPLDAKDFFQESKEWLEQYGIELVGFENKEIIQFNY